MDAKKHRCFVKGDDRTLQGLFAIAHRSFVGVVYRTSY